MSKPNSQHNRKDGLKRTANGQTKISSSFPALPPGKKLVSLSAFQPHLGSRTSSLSSISSRKDSDRILMPPPSRSISPVKMSAPFISASGAKSNGSDAGSTIGNRKGKAKEVIEILSSDEDEAKEVKPGAIKQGASQMWTELYAPMTEAELAPGKARINKVKAWLHESLYGYPPESAPLPETSCRKIRKYRRLLLLTGSAGAGKTTTVKLLAEEMGVDVIEWGEGVEEWSLGGSFERESSISKFTSFLSRNSYPSLPISSQSAPSPTPSSSLKPRLILLTSLPNLSHIPTRDAWHAALLDFCQSFSNSSCPMIIIHSDAGSGGRVEESWMDRERGGREGAGDIVGRDVKKGPWCQEIEFIPVAPTFMTKALSRIVSLALPSPRHPSKSTLQLIAQTSNGDLRSAINSLQLLCSSRSLEEKGKVGSKRKGRVESDDVLVKKRGQGRGSKGGKGAKLDVGPELRAVLDAVTRKEQSLNLFHSLGKVFYNKRFGDPNYEVDDQEVLSAIGALPPDDPLPPHLAEFDRRKSLVQWEDYVPSIPIDASSFALWIHQSFPSFCDDIEQVSRGMDELCSADIMRTDDDIWHSSPQAIAYSLFLTIRGVHLALPSPVKRAHQKIIKPLFFSNYTLTRSNDDALGRTREYLEKRGVREVNARADQRNVMEFDDGDDDDDGKRVESVGGWGGMVGKEIMSTEVIPMLVKIQALSNRPYLPSTARPLVLPPFTPISKTTPPQASHELTAQSDLLDVDEDSYEEVAAGDDGLGNIPGHDDGSVGPSGEGDGGVVWDDTMETGGEEEKMYISDDDVVEDMDDWDKLDPRFKSFKL